MRRGPIIGVIFFDMELNINNFDVPIIITSKKVYEDRTLNVTAKGLYTLITSVLIKRKYTIEELSIVAGISQPAIFNELRNLATAGYLRIDKFGNIEINGYAI